MENRVRNGGSMAIGAFGRLFEWGALSPDGSKRVKASVL
jgi:hypothetical protein